MFGLEFLLMTNADNKEDTMRGNNRQPACKFVIIGLDLPTTCLLNPFRLNISGLKAAVWIRDGLNHAFVLFRLRGEAAPAVTRGIKEKR